MPPRDPTETPVIGYTRDEYTNNNIISNFFFRKQGSHCIKSSSMI